MTIPGCKGDYSHLLDKKMIDILRQKNSKDTKSNDYDDLMKALKSPNIEAKMLIYFLREMEQCIVLLDEDYQHLVKNIMKCNWLYMCEECIEAFKSFLLHLVSAHLCYLEPCLKMLIRNFFSDETKLASYSLDERKKLLSSNFHHVHSLLRSVFQLVPMTPVIVLPVLRNNFPYLTKGPHIFEQYTLNLFEVISYVPSLRLELLELVVKNMLKLDTRASREQIQASLDKVCEKDAEDVFAMDVDEGTSESQTVLQQKKEDALATDLPVALSLDKMTCILFNYIKTTCYSEAGVLKWDITKRLYRELLSVFDKYIFLTHGSCHVQYTMFLICSFKEELADGFIDYLWKKVTDPQVQSVYRKTAAYYLSSFLSRANYISLRTAKETLNLQVRWIHKYIDTASDQTITADLIHHAAFYSVCQCVFYVFCFKHMEFMQMHKGYKWAQALNLQRIITSKLNPLRVCSPVIVKIFASSTRLHQLAFCDTVIERNNRYKLPLAASSHHDALAREKELDTFFPFDPYLLPRSSSYIVPIFKEFHGSITENEEEKEDDDEDDFLPAEEIPSNQLAMSLGKSPVDLLNYGTSPGFLHCN